MEYYCLNFKIIFIIIFMAKGKNTVLVYRDWMATFEALEDDEAGRLIKHFFKFINDENPIAPDRITKIVFEPIRQQLERDLTAWKKELPTKIESGRNGGIKSGETRRKKIEERSKTKQNEENEANTLILHENEANEGVKVKVKVNVKDINTQKESANEFNFDFVEDSYKIAFLDWVEYRKQKKPFTLQVSIEAAYRELKTLSQNSPLEAIKIVQHSMSNEFLSLVKKNELFKNKYDKQPAGDIKATVSKGVPDT